jgi:preprotein translocase subunit SecG
MYAFIWIIHLLVCLALVAVVLVQSGKGGGLAGGAFGGSAQTVFGGRGATDFITRATMVLGGAFFVTSLVLALMSSGVGNAPRSVLQKEAGATPTGAPPQTQGPAPSSPAPAAPAGGGSAPAPSSAPSSGGGSPPPSGGGQ